MIKPTIYFHSSGTRTDPNLYNHLGSELTQNINACWHYHIANTGTEGSASDPQNYCHHLKNLNPQTNEHCKEQNPQIKTPRTNISVLL